MGEYARTLGPNGGRVKIGTCEDMLYLRADQARLVWAQSGNVDPVADRLSIRFRFPWPDEDDVAPGEFADPFRALVVPGVSTPAELDHDICQFVSDRGYNVCLPCPEGSAVVFSDGGDPDAEPTPLRVHRNGWPGAVAIVQQKYLASGALVLICQCRGCQRAYRLETLAEAAPVLEGLAAMAEAQLETARRNGTEGNADVARFYLEIAKRITKGYALGNDTRDHPAEVTV